MSYSKGELMDNQLHTVTTKGRLTSPQRLLIGLGVMYIFLFALHCIVGYYGDDLYYKDMVNEMGLFPFIQWFYVKWSGRVISNILTGFFVRSTLTFWLWRFLNPLVILFLVHGIVRLTSAKINLRNHLFVLLLFFLIGGTALDESIFWATGSFYYVWPLTAAVYLLIPFFRLAFRQESTLRHYPVYIVLAVVAGLCNEQVFLCAMGVMLVTSLHYVIKARRVPLRHIILFVVTLASGLAMLLAPGVPLRVLSEIKDHQPDFGDLSTLDKISNGIPWFFSRSIMVLYLLAVLLFGVALYRYWKKSGPAILRWIFFCVLALTVAVGFPLRMLSFVSYDAVAATAPFPAAVQSLGSYIWALFFLALLILLFRLNAYYGLAFLAGTCSAITLFFSPTMIASGHRTWFVFAVICIILILAQWKKRNVNTFLLAGTACFSLLHIFYLVARLVANHIT